MVVHMGRARQFIVVVIVSLLVAAALLSPGREEQAAMLASEGRHNAAIALLERQLAGSPRDPDFLAALGRSHAALGEVHRAIDAFDAYLTVRPDDLATRERQAVLLLQSGSIDLYLKAVAQAVAAKPSPDRVTRLIELFRLHGRVEDELAALRTYAGMAMLETSQLERLGAMLAERGDWGEARRWLELADRKAQPGDWEGRLLLLEIAIQSNQLDSIYERAQAWMKAWRSAFLSGRLILRIARSGHTILASGLALKYADLMPDDTFEVAGLLARRGYNGLAHQMLVRWADRVPKPTGRQLRAFAQVSALLGDMSLPLGKLARLARDGSNLAALGDLADELSDAFGQPALISMRPLLSNEALLARPLFAAELSLFEGNREMARWFLSRIEPAELPADRLAAWLGLLNRVEGDAGAFSRLAVLWSAGRLPAELIPHFAELAVKMGDFRTHDLIWASARQ
jgi:Flp pilus assembly protein TadD